MLDVLDNNQPEVIRIPKKEETKGPGAESAESEDATPELMNRSVVRAMTLLTELGNHPGGITAAELATITGLARPTVFRLLQTLAYKGMALRNDKRFSLGHEVVRLGRIADPYRGLRSQIEVFIEGVSAELNEVTSYSVVEGPTQLHLLAEADGPHMLSTAMGYIGKDMPLHASAMGKLLLANLSDEQVLTLLPEDLESFQPNTITSPTALLAELAEVRATDYAIMDNELEEGLYAVAVPVRDRSNFLIGILAVSGLDQRMKSTDISVYVSQLREAAQRLLDTVIEA